MISKNKFVKLRRPPNILKNNIKIKVGLQDLSGECISLFSLNNNWLNKIGYHKGMLNNQENNYTCKLLK